MPEGVWTRWNNKGDRFAWRREVIDLFAIHVHGSHENVARMLLRRTA
jgi:hypothetical protein